MAKIEPRVLKGFRDYLPAVMVPRRTLLAAVERVFQRFGFAPLDTPALEYAEILTGKYGGEGDKLLYRFLDNGGRDIALRYDLTVPLARVVAQHGELSLPWRRYQIAPVWRAEKPARGRFREFVQCDGDIVGSADVSAEGEILQLAASLLEELGVERFTIRVNHRHILSGLMHRAGVSGGAAEAAVLRTIDKLPKIGREECERLLATDNGLSREQIEAIFEFLGIEGDTAGVLDRLRTFFADSEVGRDGVEELARLFAIVEALGLSESVRLDLSIARGLDYYTGTVYEGFLSDLPGFGAVLAGGRYDGLIGAFKGQDIPAVGVSLGVDRLLSGLVELGLLQESAAVASVLVTVFDADHAPHAARIARELRQGGVACAVFPQHARLKKQFRHAERAGLRYVVVCGPDDAARGELQVKDLVSGEQSAVREDGAAAWLRARLEASEGGSGAGGPVRP